MLPRAVLFSVIAVLGAPALVFSVEEDHGGSIATFGMPPVVATTVTTGRLRRKVPRDRRGRGIAASLMVGGITCSVP